MSMITELRESVLQNNNTAQEELNGIISRMNPNSRKIVVSNALHGELDLSILNKEGFNHIEEIDLAEGEITEIANIPDSVRILRCPNQLLINLSNLPPKLNELHCEYNYISLFDGSKLPELKKLNISHNQLENISNVPKHLEELYCTNNKLKIINLVGNSDLKVLHVSENPTLVIEHIPHSLIDLKSDNSPFVKRSYEDDTHIVSRPIEKMNDKHTKEKINYLEALHFYMQTKKSYEEKLLKMKKDAYYSAKTKSLAKRAVSQIKPKCINCKRPVGTIFSLKNDKYTAICGDTNLSTKCNLNIELYRGYWSDETSILYLYKNEMDKSKETIIRQKLDTLFQYVDERTSSNRFKKSWITTI